MRFFFCQAEDGIRDADVTGVQTCALRISTRTSIDVLLVRVDTDAGVSGWGESFGHRIFPATRAAIDTVLGPMCVGRDPTQISAIHDDLQRLLHGVGRNGPPIYALSGLDIAVWAIAGKVAGVPLKGGIPTAAGENYGTVWDFRRAFEAGAIDYAQPSVTKIGGVTELCRVTALAETFGVTVVPHSAYFGPGLLASIHCSAAMPGETLVERFYCDFAKNPLGDAINPVNGRIAVPQGPGLGVDPDPRML